ncbi:thermonuclease family protein, partial [Candidatus Bathyarchaeota archaeon]|nr:thermonuclease family protein [Candidatus Bathyarchaeota archaeon]
MDSKKYRVLVLLSLVLLQCFVPVVHGSSSGEIDETTVVSWVVDGDTFDTTSGDTIRLADIDTPELGKSGYYEARDRLISLVYNKQVFLDIDDISRTDLYNRLVCVVYVEYNTTFFKNV